LEKSAEPQTDEHAAAAPAAERAGAPSLAETVLAAQRAAGNRAATVLARRLLQRSVPAGTHLLERNRDSEEFPWEGYAQGAYPLSEWLGFYEFRRQSPPDASDEGCEFNMWKHSTADAVAGVFVDEGARAGLAYDRAQVYKDVKAALKFRREAGNDPGLGAAHGAAWLPGAQSATDSNVQLVLGVQFNLTKHWSKQGSQFDPFTVQLNGQITLPLHKDDEPGVELSAQASVAFFLQVSNDGKADVIGIPDVKETTASATINNVQVAGQAAWVVPLIKDLLQLQAFAQAIAGVGWSQVPDGGSRTGASAGVMTFKADSMRQLAVGAQVVFTIPNTGKHLQFFGQLQRSWTWTRPGDTNDAQAAGGIQYTW